MTEREKFEINEKKQEKLLSDQYKCCYPGCDKPAVYLAHRLSQTKRNLKDLGEGIIHHPFNLVSVCENQSHNDYFSIGQSSECFTKLFILISGNQLKSLSSQEVSDIIGFE